MPKPCRARHGDHKPGCPLCYKAATDPRYADLWGEPAPTGEPPPAPAPTGTPAAPCSYRGRELSGPERQAAGKGHVKLWVYCLHPARPLGPVVCGCEGCGPKCVGYLARAGEIPAPPAGYGRPHPDPDLDPV